MICDGVKFCPSSGQMERAKTFFEKECENSVRRLRARIGESECVDRLLRKYGKPNTVRSYLLGLMRYFDFLKSIGVNMKPDDLILDNLRCLYSSGPVDVATKRKHTEWLDLFINKRLVEEGVSERTRWCFAAAIKQFYKRNDSPLFGDFSISSQEVKENPNPLRFEEIQKVLKTMSLNLRTPLLLSWQSGCEISRILALTWSQVAGIDRNEYPLQLKFFGRKKHKRPYYTFIGQNSIEHLKIWREKWIELIGRDPTPDNLVFLSKRKSALAYSWLNAQFRGTAKKALYLNFFH